MYDKALDKVQYVDLSVDVHHIFPSKWCIEHDIDPALRESIVNKTPLSAETNRAIGGFAPSTYLSKIEKRAGIDAVQLDTIVATHLADAAELRVDDFDAFFDKRLAKIISLIERTTGKPVQNDMIDNDGEETLERFDQDDIAVMPDLEELEVGYSAAAEVDATVDGVATRRR